MQRDDNQNYPIKDFYVLLYDIYGGRFSVFSGSWHMYFCITAIKIAMLSINVNNFQMINSISLFIVVIFDFLEPCEPGK
jgi:hypothetical protein